MSEQLEAHYAKSPFVKEVCVLALDDRLHAVVVANMDMMRQRKIVNVGDLLRFELEGLSYLLPAERRIPSYEIWFEPLPRTSTREIERDEVERRVRARAHAATLRDAALSEDERAWLDESHAAAVLPLIQARVERDTQIRPDANLEIDLGLDSMDRVELLTELEQRFGVRLSTGTAAAIFTVRQLVEATRGGQVEAAAPGRAWSAIFKDLPASTNRDFAWLLRRRTLTGPLLWVLFKLARRLFARVRVTGLDRLPPSGPYIIAPNHQSYVDPLLFCSVLPYRVFKDVFFVGAVEYFETTLTRAAAHAVNLVPVDPDSNLVPAMRAGAFGLTHGRILLVFPEGERSIDGTVKKFKKGAPILAQHLGVPIVPVALRGIYELWPRNGSLNWSLVAPWSGHRVRIAIGEPLALPAGAPYTDSANALRSRVIEMWEALST